MIFCNWVGADPLEHVLGAAERALGFKLAGTA
jgi:hypothetical protein